MGSVISRTRVHDHPEGTDRCYPGRSSIGTSEFMVDAFWHVLLPSRNCPSAPYWATAGGDNSLARPAGR